MLRNSSLTNSGRPLALASEAELDAAMSKIERLETEAGQLLRDIQAAAKSKGVSSESARSLKLAANLVNTAIKDIVDAVHGMRDEG